MPPLLRLLRLHQWTKNAFVFAPLFFALRFTDAESWRLTLIAALAFALAASAAYVLNDLADAEADRLHPLKRLRPIAAGQVSRSSAVLLMLALFAGAYALAWALPVACSWVLTVYIWLNVLYTLRLKRVAILDVMVIASGFVLRVLAGGYALGVWISPWIIVTSFMLALLLGFGKRLHEFGHGNGSRASLAQYNRELLTILIANSSIGALLCYTLYTVELAQRSGRVELTYTVAFVAFGLFRYTQQLFVHGEGGEPEKLLWRDKAFPITILLWLGVTLFILVR